MKFRKISLDESLFDDFIDSPVELVKSDTHPSFYDDDFSAPDYMPDMEEPLEGPNEGSDTGVADLIINAINEEWGTIRQYNSLVATLRVESINNPQYNSFIDVVNDIINEENKHVGQLQEVLQQISPNAKSIESGRYEGRSQMNLTNGVLMVKSWDEVPRQTSESNNTPNQIDDTCSIVDVDDEM